MWIAIFFLQKDNDKTRLASKFYVDILFTFLIVTKKRNCDDFFSTCLRQSRKKLLAHFNSVRVNGHTPAPSQCWPQPCRQQLYITPQRWMIGVGKYGIKGGLCAFNTWHTWQNRVLHCNTALIWTIWPKCANYLFPWLSEASGKKIITIQFFGHNKKSK